MKLGSIKLRRVRGGVSIRATGDMGERLAASLADMTSHALEKRRLRLTFVDEGQDVLTWDLADGGRITSCKPYQADIFVGGQVHGIPTPGEQPMFSFPRSKDRRRCAWTVETVELLP